MESSLYSVHNVCEAGFAVAPGVYEVMAQRSNGHGFDSNRRHKS
jgi:hypothetical protein